MGYSKAGEMVGKHSKKLKVGWKTLRRNKGVLGHTKEFGLYPKGNVTEIIEEIKQQDYISSGSLKKPKRK